MELALRKNGSRGREVANYRFSFLPRQLDGVKAAHICLRLLPRDGFDALSPHSNCAGTFTLAYITYIMVRSGDKECLTVGAT